MIYDPSIHHRRSIRLQGFDYSKAGAYFITICTHHRLCRFGKIKNGEMRFNPIGWIVSEQWKVIPERYQMVKLDEFVVMPNHIHGIFAITTGTRTQSSIPNPDDPVGAPARGANLSDTAKRAPARGAPTVGDIVGSYKSLCVHHCLKWTKGNTPEWILGTLWQRNFWEHIIRNESELDRIREYIRTNPAQWQSDCLYIENQNRKP